MRSIRTTSLMMCFALFGALFLPLPSEARAQQPTDGDSCDYSPDTTVDVLLLIDQSRSLRTSDSEHQRIPGARAVVEGFASLDERVSSVRMMVAGFGTDFSGEWTQLNAATKSDVLHSVEQFRDRDSDWHTDYVEAMHGVVQAFASSDASCRFLFWFTDGRHDLDPSDALLGEGGLPRSYPADGPVIVTTKNHADVEGMMLDLICGRGGYADQLGGFGVRVEVLLLGNGETTDPQSARVLQGMGGGSAEGCGPGNGGYARVENAEDLPYELACSSQVGTLRLPDPQIAENGMLTVTDADIAHDKIPAPLLTSLRLFAAGSGGLPTVVESDLPGLETSPNETNVRSVSADLPGEEFRLILSGVERACVFVTAVAPNIEVTPTTLPLYRGEPGEFFVHLSGPHGDITGVALGGIQVEASHGEIIRAGTRTLVRVSRMPDEEKFSLVVKATAGELSSTTQAAFPVNEPSDAPKILGAAKPIEADGPGPFVSELLVDGKEGGTLCIEDQAVTIADDAGAPLEVSATFDGDYCVDVDPGSGHRFDLEISISRQANAHDVLKFRTASTPAAGPQRSDSGALSVDLKVLPLVNTGILMVIVAAILLILIGLLWAVLYGVNRLIARIPDVRKNKVRFGEFTARLTSDERGQVRADLVDAPVDAELRVPRATPSQMRAGRLTLRRRVPVRPWIPPGAELTMDTDFVAVRIGSGAAQAVVMADRRLQTHSRVALGPLVAIGAAKGQLERVKQGAQSVQGVVVFDSRSARGRDAGEAVAELIREGLVEIAGRMDMSEGLREEGMPRR